MPPRPDARPLRYPPQHAIARPSTPRGTAGPYPVHPLRCGSILGKGIQQRRIPAQFFATHQNRLDHPCPSLILVADPDPTEVRESAIDCRSGNTMRREKSRPPEHELRNPIALRLHMTSANHLIPMNSPFTPSVGHYSRKAMKIRGRF